MAVREMIEIWKPIKEEPEYEVSNLGNIRSLGTTRTVNSRWGKKMVRKTKEKNLKPFKSGEYCAVRFHEAGKTYYVHRLVAFAFLQGEIDLEVNHKDGRKSNNNLSNLELLTPSENMLHRTHILGLRRGQFGQGRVRVV